MTVVVVALIVGAFGGGVYVGKRWGGNLQSAANDLSKPAG